MSEPSFRRDWITKPLFGFARRALPSLSATEREAIEAGEHRPRSRALQTLV
jgi:acyl-CoA dehydrogenase